MPGAVASAAASATATAALLLAAGCASTPAPRVVVPEALAVPAGEGVVFALEGRGVQLYECRLAKGSTTTAEWVHHGPEATLAGAPGGVSITHGAGMSWSAPDGSKLVGTVRRKVDGPTPGALPWLLVETQASGRRDGLLAKVQHVQRVDVHGGAMPAAEACTPARAGQVERVPFDAQFVFHGARWSF